MSLKLKIIVILFSVFGLQSCVDSFLDKLPKSTIAMDDFYKTDADFKAALVGCYEAINTPSIPNFGQVQSGTYNYGLYYFLDGCSDIAIATPTFYTGQDMVRGSYLTSQSEINCFWNAFYAGISRCNYLLDHINSSTLTSTQKKQYTGEARFLRAFYYLHLAKLFGGVPIANSSTPDPKAPRNSLQEVYGFIIDDLTYASDSLTATGRLGNASANKWTAGAYLGETYNYLASCKRYDVGKSLLAQCPLNDFSWVDAPSYSVKARDILASVINDGPYILVPKADYPKLFHEMSKSTQYKECLLMSEFSANTSKGNLIYYLFSPSGYLYGGSYQRVFPTMKLYKSYETSTVSADIRRDMFITGNYPATKTIETIDANNYFVPSPSKPTSTSDADWCTGKFRCVDPASRTLAINLCTTNHPLMRLADVYLQYAEALYFSNDEPTARAQFDIIRARITTNPAALRTAYTRTDFVQELLEERARELCFESKRRIDLVRFGKTTEYINGLPLEGTKNLKDGITSTQSYWKADHSADFKIWLPIPQPQVDLNQNLVQNAGY